MNNQETSKIAISDKKQRIFLASPYTHQDEEVMTFRYKEALKASARLINEGYIVFSPIVHCHPIAIRYNLPRDYSFWQDYSNSFILYWAELFNILCLDNWKSSVGIKDESALAREVELPVSFIYVD